MGIISAHIKKLLLTFNSIQRIPRRVDVARSNNPVSPVIRKIIDVRKIIMIIEIFL